MKKTTPVLSLLTTLLWGQALHAETYTYTGPNFTDVAGGYTTSMSVTASITTSAPIPPNETGYDIIPLVTNWSMSDGVNTLQNGPDSYLFALVDTDSAGHVVGGLIGATYALSVPPLVGDTVDEITIRSNPPTNIAADDKLCTADDGEQCTSYDSSASFGWVAGYGTWTGDHVFEDGFEGGPAPPSACEVNAELRVSTGCLFYSIDAQNYSSDSLTYAVGVVNVSESEALVAVKVRSAGTWVEVDSATVLPSEPYYFPLANRSVTSTALNESGAYRIESDVPVAAYQFQPILGQQSYTSDASLLLPVSSYDQEYLVAGWGQAGTGRAQINIVAWQDDTVVTFTPSITTQAGAGIPAVAAGTTYEFAAILAGDVLQIESGTTDAGFGGTKISANNPIAVFSTHTLASVPTGVCCGDHLEEQLTGPQTWGHQIVAARFPVRSSATPESSYWHLLAPEDNTTVTFDKHADVTGLPESAILNGGEYLELVVGGTVSNPGDFVVSADKPIALVQYLAGSGSTDVGASEGGDPAMALTIPTEQFSNDFHLLVPNEWLYDYLMITKPAGAEVSIDGLQVAQEDFISIGTADAWETARIAVGDGTHHISGSAPVSVTVVGWDAYDSYAYPASSKQAVINQ